MFSYPMLQKIIRFLQDAPIVATTPVDGPPGDAVDVPEHEVPETAPEQHDGTEPALRYAVPVAHV